MVGTASLVPNLEANPTALCDVSSRLILPTLVAFVGGRFILLFSRKATHARSLRSRSSARKVIAIQANIEFEARKYLVFKAMNKTLALRCFVDCGAEISMVGRHLSTPLIPSSQPPPLSRASEEDLSQ